MDKYLKESTPWMIEFQQVGSDEVEVQVVVYPKIPLLHDFYFPNGQAYRIYKYRFEWLYYGSYSLLFNKESKTLSVIKPGEKFNTYLFKLQPIDNSDRIPSEEIMITWKEYWDNQAST